MKKILIIFLLLCLLLLTGCVRVVDSTMEYSIPGFKEYYKIYGYEETESYLREGHLDFATIENVIFCPRIKEISHENCRLFLTAHVLDKEIPVTVNRFSLVTKNGLTLCEEDALDFLLEFESETETLLYGTVTQDFEMNDSWYFAGNELLLTYTVTVGEGENKIQKEFSYTVTLIGHKALLMPT